MGLRNPIRPSGRAFRHGAAVRPPELRFGSENAEEAWGGAGPQERPRGGGRRGCGQGAADGFAVRAFSPGRTGSGNRRRGCALRRLSLSEEEFLPTVGGRAKDPAKEEGLAEEAGRRLPEEGPRRESATGRTTQGPRPEIRKAASAAPHRGPQPFCACLGHGPLLQQPIQLDVENPPGVRRRAGLGEGLRGGRPPPGRGWDWLR